MRFVPQHLRSLVPAGRLDIDSVGLLVLTQDGRIARQLIGEDSAIEKEYLVRVAHRAAARRCRPATLALLRHGLSLDGEALRPAEVEWLNDDQLRFVLREGKKRQIRRMCEAVGLQVLGLKRVRIGGVVLGELPAGQWRYLRVDERFVDGRAARRLVQVEVAAEQAEQADDDQVDRDDEVEQSRHDQDQDAGDQGDAAGRWRGSGSCECPEVVAAVWPPRCRAIRRPTRRRRSARQPSPRLPTTAPALRPSTPCYPRRCPRSDASPAHAARTRRWRGAARARPRRPDGLRQDAAALAIAAALAPRRAGRDRQRRFGAGLPRHGHRHRQAERRRARRGAAPPDRHHRSGASAIRRRASSPTRARLIAEIRARGRWPLLVGGTMMYFKALVDGLDALPAADAASAPRSTPRRARAAGRRCTRELARVDPATAARLAPNDRSASSARSRSRAERHAAVGAGTRAPRRAAAPPLIALEPARPRLAARAHRARFDAMLADAKHRKKQPETSHDDQGHRRRDDFAW